MSNDRSLFADLDPGTFDAEPARIVPFPGRMPERLVGVGFRCWLAGFETGDITSWEEAWNTYQEPLGAEAAKPLILSLSQFVRAVKATASRDIQRYPASARGFCRDECLAISVIAACQHDARSALCTCAAALIGSNDIGDTLSGAQDFACALKAADQILSASSICAANCPLMTPRGRLQ
ncbi:MAG: hypothetical protein ABL907_24515 [Hyphomicrobium sp.]